MTKKNYLHRLNELTDKANTTVSEYIEGRYVNEGKIDKFTAQVIVNKYGTQVSKLILDVISNEDSENFNRELCKHLKKFRKMNINNLQRHIQDLYYYATTLARELSDDDSENIPEELTEDEGNWLDPEIPEDAKKIEELFGGVVKFVDMASSCPTVEKGELI